MTPVDALKLALNEEIKAIELYKGLAIEHAVVKDTLSFLADEEHKHKQLLEKRIYEITR